MHMVGSLVKLRTYKSKVLKATIILGNNTETKQRAICFLKLNSL